MRAGYEETNVNQRRRNWLILLIVAGVVIALVALRLYRLRSGTAVVEGLAAPEPTPALETAVAFIGNLSASASASGQIVARREAQLAFETPGLVAETWVRVGDNVRAGQPLVGLESADLLLNVATAEQALAIQEAAVAALQTPASAAQIAAAEAGLTSAQAALDNLLSGPDPDRIAAAEAAVRAANANISGANSNLGLAQGSISQADILAAETALSTARAQQWSAQVAYDREVQDAAREGRDIQQRMINDLNEANNALAVAQAAYDALLAGPSQDVINAAQANVSAAIASRDAAQANLDLLRNGASPAQLAAAEAQVAQAAAALESLTTGATAEQLAVANAQLEQARLNLEGAQAALAQATLTAPFDGVVTLLNVAPGELATGVVVELVDTNSFEVVLDVDEVDIGDLAVGQPAAITLEAWPDVAIDSAISAIAPSAFSGPSVAVGPVTYQVHVGLGATDLPVRLGLTANANLITANRENVLLVPNQAVRSDRATGRFFVTLLLGATTQEVEVTIGLRDAQYTQITSGLNAGDVVVLNAAALSAASGN